MAREEPDNTQSIQLAHSIEAELEAEGLEHAEVIGRGGFGIVFRCHQASLDRTVAVKVLSSDFDSDSRERFLREQRAMAQLSGHPNVVEVLHADVALSGRPYIVMPYHRRGSLGAHIERHGPISWEDAVGIGVKVAGALESGHRLGILHRDVKPGNILVTGYGEPQLADFGIARIAGAFETTSGAIMGSPAYIAPELVAGEPASVESDLYGLGATLFCLVTGHAAVERRVGEDVVAHFVRVASSPVPNLGQRFPQDLAEVVERVMALSPRNRPATAAEFGEQLRDLQRRHGHRVVDMAILSAVPDDGSPVFVERQHAAISLGSTPPPSATSAPPPSAATKFHPPLAARALVRRTRLLDRIFAAGCKRLVVIHAPAGFGKSTLAAQWREHLMSEDIPVAWLSIDPDDNNLTWFLEHLIEAIQQVRRTLAIELRQELEAHGDDAARYVLTLLINEIHQARDRFALVIDDWHRVTDPATTAALDLLLEKGCHHLQVIVTSRSSQGLPLSRMRVSDELVEIDSADLRFDLEESHEFLVDLADLPLADQDVAHLRKSTDGWVAALQLASLSLRNHDDPTDFINHLSGRHRAIAEYLADNVLSTLEPTLLDFMLTTSVSERICAELAASLSGLQHCQALLEDVEQRDLFLWALDDDRRWFRYHHLFADFLRRRLDRDHPGRLTALHRAASQWFSDQGMLSEAVDHALAAGDPDRAADLVERDGLDLLEHSRMSTLLGLIAKLPPGMVEDRPRLQITIGWADVLLHHPPGPTQKSLETTKSMLEARAASGGDDIAAQILEASMVQGACDMFADRIDSLLEPALQIFARPEILRPWLVAGAANMASFEALHRFDFAAARRWIERADPYHKRVSGPFSVLYGYCFAGIAAHEQLDIDAAETLFRRAGKLARRTGGTRSYAVKLAGAVLAELLYERGCLAEAEQLLDDSYQLGSEGGVVDFMLITYGIGSRIKAARGERGAAVQRLDEGERIAASMSLPRLAAQIENERVRCNLPHHDSTATPTVEDWSGPDGHVNGIAVRTAELREDAQIRLLLRGCESDIREACGKAEIRMYRIHASRRPKAHLQARLLFGACLHAADRNRDALDILAPAVMRCAELGLPQFLLDAGPDMGSLCRMFIEEKDRDTSVWPQLSRSFLDDVLRLA